MVKAIVPIIVFFAFCVGIGFGYYYNIKVSEKETKGGASKKGTPEVILIKINKENVTIEEEFPGRVVANRVAEIRPQVGGIITKRLFEEGSDVEAGQQLYQIESATYQATFDKANADLQKATTQLKLMEIKNLRYGELIKVDGISKQEFDDMQTSLALSKADLKIAEVALSNAKIILEYTKIIAPISGRISKSFVNEGSLVTPSQSLALAVITQFDQVYVDISQSITDYQRLREKLDQKNSIKATLYFGEGQVPYSHEGELQFSGIMVEKSTGSISLRVIFPNKELQLLPGLFAKVKLKLSTQEGFLIPQRACNRNQDGELFVWKYDEKEAVRQVVINPIKTIGNNWLISRGLNEGDRIVYKGFQKIPPDSKVLVKEESKPQ
jgi:membrane fusion protein (multidrug efflux system)